MKKKTRWLIAMAVVAVIFLAGCAGEEPKPPADHEGSGAVWTFFRGNSPGAAGVADEVVKPPLAVLWSFEVERSVDAVEELPAAEGEGSESAEEGEQSAPVVTGEVRVKDPVRSSPVVFGGIVVFGSQGGIVYALDVETGKEIWQFKTGDSILASPLILDGVVYIGSMDHKMYALDLKTGENVMKTGGEGEPGFEAKRGIKGGAATDGMNIYFGALDKILYALNAETFMLEWTFETRDWIEAAPAVVDGVVYVGSNDGFMYALNAKDGNMLWRYETGDCVYSTPAVLGGVVYFSSWDGYVYALDVENGARMWSAKIDDQVSASPVVSGGRVFVGSAFVKGDLVALDAGTGEEVWRTPSRGGGYDAGPVLSGDVLYVGSYDMYLYAYDAGTGKLLWEKLMKEWVRGSVAVANNTVFAGAGNGKFYALVSAE